MPNNRHATSNLSHGKTILTKIAINLNCLFHLYPNAFLIENKLVGAAVFVIQFKEAGCFTLGRNVNLHDHNSHEIRDQQPASSNSNRESSFEVGDRLTDEQEAQNIFDEPFFRQAVEKKGFSNVIPSSQISSFLATTQKPTVVQTPAADSGQSISRQFDILDEVVTELGGRSAFPVNQVVDGRASSKDESLNAVRFRHSNERNDDSSEVGIRPFKNGKRLSLEREMSPVNLDATDFHNRQYTEFLIQPESEDWFLVKQYMDDEQFRDASEELAGEYFWQPVKNSKTLDSESAEDSNESD